MIGNLIHEISDHYADYKTGESPKGNMMPGVKKPGSAQKKYRGDGQTAVPIGWGTAIALAVGSVGTSYGLGQDAGALYNTFGEEINLVKATGAGRICQ